MDNISRSAFEARAKSGMLPKMTRKEATDAGVKFYFTGKACKYGHVAARSTNHGECGQCHAERSAKLSLENPDENARRVRASTDPSSNRAKASLWKKQNPERVAINVAMRQRRIVHANSVWANNETIKMMYLEAQRLTIETGVRHHVDHIVPLNSSVVCGLHNEFNLMVTTALDNLKKGNRKWPDMWGD